MYSAKVARRNSKTERKKSTRRANGQLANTASTTLMESWRYKSDGSMGVTTVWWYCSRWSDRITNYNTVYIMAQTNKTAAPPSSFNQISKGKHF